MRGCHWSDRNDTWIAPSFTRRSQPLCHRSLQKRSARTGISSIIQPCVRSRQSSSSRCLQLPLLFGPIPGHASCAICRTPTSTRSFARTRRPLTRSRSHGRRDPAARSRSPAVPRGLRARRDPSRRAPFWCLRDERPERITPPTSSDAISSTRSAFSTATHL